LITLYDWRVLKKMGQGELAKKLGVSQPTVSLTENGLLSKKVKDKFIETYGDEYKKIFEFKKDRRFE